MDNSTRVTRASTKSKAIPTAGTKPSRYKAASRTTAAPKVAPAVPNRKPLLDSNIESPAKKAVAKTLKSPLKPFHPSTISLPSDSEPITAYLRIRPHAEYGDEFARDAPYLERISDTAVRMTDPMAASANVGGRTSSAINVSSSMYNFSRVFEPDTNQASFFETTTLPLISDVLSGRNALIFAYGVTNSGKTYTMHGGKSPGSAGILPRAFDVLFNSISGLHSDDQFQPVRLYGLERVESESTPSAAPVFDISTFATHEPSLKHVIDELQDMTLDAGIDHTALKVDRNHEYSIWISYAEVYNEQVFDLLSAQDTSGKYSKIVGPSIKRKALTVKSSPPSDFGGFPGCGRYIEGLRRFRVRDAAQAKALVRRGQLHRRAFGTLANSESSRSHGLVTITVVRGHRRAKDDPEAMQISRLTFVDLAGSERNKNTNTTGDRLKEAGSINRSLLVLGQCMEVMRSNQKKLAQSLALPGRMETLNVKRGLGVVPFRHSKVTEILMDFFDRDGRGRAVMIVNVNPFDTDYNENAHVMKFAALAREVHTASTANPSMRTLAKTATSNFHKPTKGSTLRQVTITAGGHGTGRRKSEARLQILEESEDEEEIDDTDVDPLVNYLFDQIESLRNQLYDAEMRVAETEARIREQVVNEVTEQNRLRQKIYERHLFNDDAENAWKTDAKIDLLHRSGMLHQSPRKATTRIPSPSELTEEFNITSSGSEENSASFASDASSFLAVPSRNGYKIREMVPAGPDHIRLESDDDDAAMTTDNDTSFATYSEVALTEQILSEAEEDDDNDDYEPQSIATRHMISDEELDDPLNLLPKGKLRQSKDDFATPKPMNKARKYRAKH